ncbi:unnamed protein product [Phaeothamnion confervicola]
MIQWERSLEAAADCGAAHLSVYDLQVEPRTAFGRWYTPGEAPLPTDELAADMYRRAHWTLTRAGFDHYEISNYALPGSQSAHNRAYWENHPFLAFGNGAASHLEGRRFSRPRGLKEYAAWVDRLSEEGWEGATAATAAAGGESAGGAGGEGAGKGGGKERRKGGGKEREKERELVGQQRLIDLAQEAVMVALRLTEGLDLDAFEQRFGAALTARVVAGAGEGISMGWAALEQGTDDRGHGGGRAGLGDGGDGDVGIADGGSGDGGRNPTGRGRRDTRGNGGSTGEVSGGGGGDNNGKGRRLRLVAPEGFLLSNAVISSIFAELDEANGRGGDRSEDGFG